MPHACAVALILFTLVLHVSALRGWWLYDDPQLVLEAQRQPLLSLFFNPGEYVHLAAHTFVPLQLVSYKIDLLFGVRPVVFYAHQLLALMLAVVLLFFVLRQHIDEKFAAAGAALFAASWAATYAVRTLMIRHYVEGLVLALIALLLWGWRRAAEGVRRSENQPLTRPSASLSRRERDLAVAASFFYLLAMLAKEVYAPLPLIFLLIEREPRRRFAWPSAALAIYLFWRWRMTQLIGGYAPFPSLAEIVRLPPMLWTHLVGPTHSLLAPLIWAITATAIVIAFIVRDHSRAALILIAIAIVAVAPIVALAANFEWRYSFAFVTCAIAALTIAAGRVKQRWSLIVLSLLALTAAVMSFPQHREYREQTRVIEAEGHYIASQPPAAAPLAATAPEWYLGGLAELRHAAAPRYFLSRFAIVAGDVDPSRAVTFDARARLIPLTSATSFGTPAEWSRERATFAAGAPLSVDFSLAHHDASWRLGPDGGDYTFITSPGWTAIPIPQTGSRRVPAARERQWFRIRRAAPDGSWTMSPVLPVPREGETTRWKRP